MADRDDLGLNSELIGVAGSRTELATPALLIDLDAFERNIATMASHVAATGQGLRPHCKTHKSIEVARRQIEAGALGICCATLGEAEVMVDGGIPGVLITSPMVGTNRVSRLVALNRRAQGLMVAADDPGNVDALAAAARADGNPLTVLVDLDVGSHRTGVPSTQLATALAGQVEAADGLEFGGVQAYAGHLQHVRDFEARRREVNIQADWVRQVCDQLDTAGLKPAIVSGGGTGTHDLDHRAGVLTELQTGSYIFMDVDYNAVALREGDARPFETALFVRTMVVSAGHDRFVTTDAGLKAFATDGPMPALASGAPAGTEYGFHGDEHGRLIFSEGVERLRVGDVVECIAPHCDPTVNLHDLYHCVRGDTLVDIWHIDARGKR